MRLWTLQLVIIAAALVVGLGVAAFGTPLKLKAMCATQGHKDNMSQRVCADVNGG